MAAIYFSLTLVFGTTSFFLKNERFSKFALFAFLVIQIGFAVFASTHIDQNSFDFFTFNRLSVLFLVIVTILSIFTAIHSINYLKTTDKKNHSTYYASFIGLIGALTGSYLANSLTVTWIFIELTTLTSAILIYHERTPHALEATWKYIFVCSVGIAMAYMGLLFFSATVDSVGVNQVTFSSLSEIVKAANPLYLKITFLFVLVGYATKMELFPMHTVGIDANSVAPPPIGAFLSTTIVNMGFLAFLKIYLILGNNAQLISWMSNVLIFTGILSLLVAAGYMLKAKHLKRMLAYSTLENMGLVAISIGIGGNGYFIAIMLLTLHSFVKSSMFYQLFQIFSSLGSYKLNETGKYFKFYSYGAIVFLLGVIVLTAIPPSGLFITEILLFKELALNNLWWILITVAIIICYIIYALLMRVLYINFMEPIDKIEYKPLPNNKFETTIQLLLLVFVIIICFYQPQQLTEFINAGIANLAG